MKGFFSSKRFFLLYVLPLFTIFLASAAPWAQANLSLIAATAEKKLLLILWGFSLAFYLRFYMIRLFALTGYQDKISGILLVVFFALALLAVLLPYAPERFPIPSFLHVAFAFAMPLFFLLLLLRFVAFLYKKDPPRFRIFWYGTAAAGICAFWLLFRFGMVTSLLEIFVTVVICFLLRFLELRILQMDEHAKSSL